MTTSRNRCRYKEHITTEHTAICKRKFFSLSLYKGEGKVCYTPNEHWWGSHLALQGHDPTGGNSIIVCNALADLWFGTNSAQ